MIKAGALLVVAFMFSSSSLAAQEKHSMMDMDAAMKAADQLFNPAAFALSHRKDLALTDGQIKSLDSLSSGPNHIDLMDMSRPSEAEMAMDEMLLDTSSPIDEELVKKGVQAKVERETKLLIARARRDREVTGVLTTFQRVAWANLRMTMFTDMAATMTRKQ